MIPFWSTGGTEGDLYAKDPWDRLVLNINGRPQTLPGITEVSAQRELKVDKRNPAGAHGGSTTTHGAKPCDVDIQVHLWTKPQWEKMQEILRALMPSPKGGKDAAAQKVSKEAQSFSSQNPQLAAIGVGALVVVAIGTLKPGSVIGEKVLPIKAREVRPATKGKTATKGIAPPEATVAAFKNKQVATLPTNAPKPKPSTDASFCGPG